MKTKSLVFLLLLVALPLLALGWLGWRVARDEQARIEREFRRALTDRLADVAAGLAGALAERERELAEVLAAPGGDAEALRSLVRRHRFVRQVFVLAADGTLIHPPGPGQRTAEEDLFLERTRAVWADGETFSRPGDEAGKAFPVQGWYTWFWGPGRNFIFWRRGADGTVTGAEVNRSALLADLIGRLPATGAGPGPDRRPERIALEDEQGRVLYQWGGLSPRAGRGPDARFELEAPLKGWSLAVFTAWGGPATALRARAAFSLGVGLAALAVALVSLGWLFYRESTREIKDAAQKVSFVNQVSHELKTPLTNIRVYAELLQAKLPSGGPPLQRYAGVVISESERLGRLINNVLTFGRHQRGTLKLRPSRGAVDETVDRALETFRPSLESRGVQIAFSRGAGRPVLYDRDAVEQILGNLLSNVEKYAAGGKRLDVESRQEAGCVSIVVHDNGPGIPAAQRERVFEPFVRMSNRLTEGVSGTGIGLSIARQLARLHGGDVRIEPSEGGARFRLDLATPEEASA